MIPEQYFAEDADGIRRIQEPAVAACFRAVTRIWHFSTGHILLERDQHRDCLVPAVDQVDVPASDCHRVGDAVVLDTETTVEVTETENQLILREVDMKVKL